MGNSKVRVGIIGCGFGALTHIPGFQSCPDAEVVAICDVQRETAERFARKFNIGQVFSDYRKMLELKDLDLVSVATPIFLHYQMIKDVIAAGKNVLSEKPLAMTAADARDLLARAKAAKVVHAIDHEFRFIPAHARMKALIREGFVGKVNTAHILVVHDGSFSMRGFEIWGWQSQKDKGGGMLNSSGYHYIDLVRDWFGEITGAYAELETIIKERPVPNSDKMGKVDSDDAYAVLLRLASGGLVVVSSNTASHFGTGTRVEVYGSEGTLFIDSIGKWVDGRLAQSGKRLMGGKKADSALAELPIPEDLTPEGISKNLPQAVAFASEARRLVKAVQDRTGVSPNFEDGVRAAEIMDAIRKSAVEKRFVKVG